MATQEKLTQEQLEADLIKGRKRFENLDLSGLDFGYYKISQKEFANCNLSNANFIVVGDEIAECKFTDCDISHTKFPNIMMCDFRNCHGFQTDFQNSEFTQTDFTLCDFEKANFEKSNMLNTDFNNCVIKDSIFRESEIDTAQIYHNTQFFDTHFDNSKLTNCIFDDVMIYGSILRQTEVNNSSFFNAKIVESSFKNSNIQDTIFRADVVSTHLDNIKFTKCDLNNSYFAKSTTGLKTCILNECLYSPNLEKDTRLEDLRKEFIKEKEFYKAYALIELNDAIPVPDLPIRFMKEVVKEHGTDTEIFQKAIAHVAIRDHLSPNEMAKLMQDTLKTDEYKKAFAREARQGKTTEYAQ